ncbi:MAG: ABC transporter permease [Clostridia bacterium]|nr:ABC transporter permease [Clostridia bacterium]
MQLKNNLIINKAKNASVILILLVAVYLILFFATSGRFGSLQSIKLIVQQAFIPSVLAWGLCFIFTLGLYDFSIGSILVMACIVGADLSKTFGFTGLILGCLITAAVMGFLNGFIYLRLKIPSIIVTIGLMMIYEIAANLYGGGGGATLPDKYSLLGFFPNNIIVGLVAALVAFIIFKHTRLGIYIRAIGNSEPIAKNSGIRVDKIKLMSFVLTGFFTGIAAIMTVSYSGGVVPQTGMGTMARVFSPLMGCFIGMALSKYCNIVVSIFVGELILIMINTGMIAAGIDTSFQQVITGLFLLILVGITSMNKRNEVVK